MTSPFSILRSLRNFDSQIRSDIEGSIAGIDEVGRGPLAGPVVAAAVIFLDHRLSFLEGLNDSKQVLPQIRIKLFREISRVSLVGIGMATELEIDEFNIYQASRLAMKRAVLNLSRTPDFLLIDGKIKLDLPLAQRAVVQGDTKSASIAAASIIAKVYRDGLMTRLHDVYPDYGFKDHKGYATKKHLAALKLFGPSPVHRRSFEPVWANQLVSVG